MQRYVNRKATEKATLAMIERIVERGRAEMMRGEFTHICSPEEAKALQTRVNERVKRSFTGR